MEMYENSWHHEDTVRLSFYQILFLVEVCMTLLPAKGNLANSTLVASFNKPSFRCASPFCGAGPACSLPSLYLDTDMRCQVLTSTLQVDVVAGSWCPPNAMFPR